MCITYKNKNTILDFRHLQDESLGDETPKTFKPESVTFLSRYITPLSRATDSMGWRLCKGYLSHTYTGSCLKATVCLYSD